MGAVLTAATVALCPHGGPVRFTAGSPRFTIEDQPVLTEASVAVVAGCPHLVDGEPDPCVSVQWLPVGDGLRVDGHLVVTTATPTMALSSRGAPAGPLQVPASQVRVAA